MPRRGRRAYLSTRDAASLILRKGELRDAATIASFNAAMALETEHKVLMPEVIGAGVRRLIENPAMGFYIVAQDDQGEVVAGLMITNEWSDWRNGIFWWIQSVYVVSGWRRQGVYRRLYDYVRDLARADPGVCGFRLYVEKDNVIAQQTYSALGMTPTDYLIYEELKAGVEYFTRAG